MSDKSPMRTSPADGLRGGDFFNALRRSHSFSVVSASDIFQHSTDYLNEQLAYVRELVTDPISRVFQRSKIW